MLAEKQMAPSQLQILPVGAQEWTTADKCGFADSAPF
jgi:hypothetical protein